MFSNVTEEIQYPKRMVFIGIPSVIWLQSLDFIPRILGEAFCNRIKMGIAISVLFFANREFGAFMRETIGDIE